MTGGQIVGGLSDASRDACVAALSGQGFVKKRKGVLLQPGPTPAAWGFVGLNVAAAASPTVVRVNPVVGVRHMALEDVLTRTAGWPVPVVAVSRPLGYLMPRGTFVQWDFPHGSDLSAVAQELAQAVASYGQPFIDHWSDWDTFSAAITGSGLLLDIERWFVLPAVAAINGDRDLANTLVSHELQRITEAQDAYASAYRAFTKQFRSSVLAT